jgi:hypothetical protein
MASEMKREWVLFSQPWRSMDNFYPGCGRRLQLKRLLKFISSGVQKEWNSICKPPAGKLMLLNPPPSRCAPIRFYRSSEKFGYALFDYRRQRSGCFGRNRNRERKADNDYDYDHETTMATAAA